MKLSIKKILLITLLSFLVAREFTSFHLSYYKSNWNSNTTSRSNCTNTKYGNISYEYINTVDFDEAEEVGILYEGLEEIARNSSQENIIVKVNAPHISNWKYYIPFYKSISFSYDFDYYINTRIKLNKETTSVSCSGSVSISGSHRIIGVCSGKEAKQDVKDKIYQTVKNSIGGKVQEQIDGLE